MVLSPTGVAHDIGIYTAEEQRDSFMSPLDLPRDCSYFIVLHRTLNKIRAYPNGSQTGGHGPLVRHRGVFREGRALLWSHYVSLGVVYHVFRFLEMCPCLAI